MRLVDSSSDDEMDGPLLLTLSWSRHRDLFFALRQRTDSVGNMIMQRVLAFSKEVLNEVYWTEAFEVNGCNVTSDATCCLPLLIGGKAAK